MTFALFLLLFISFLSFIFEKGVEIEKGREWGRRETQRDRDKHTETAREGGQKERWGRQRERQGEKDGEIDSQKEREPEDPKLVGRKERIRSCHAN